MHFACFEQCLYGIRELASATSESRNSAVIPSVPLIILRISWLFSGLQWWSLWSQEFVSAHRRGRTVLGPHEASLQGHDGPGGVGQHHGPAAGCGQTHPSLCENVKTLCWIFEIFLSFWKSQGITLAMFPCSLSYNWFSMLIITYRDEHHINPKARSQEAETEQGSSRESRWISTVQARQQQLDDYHHQHHQQVPAYTSSQ